MTRWYPYRWLCDKCGAVHYYEAPICCRCGHSGFNQQINNPQTVSEIKAGKHPKYAYNTDLDPDKPKKKKKSQNLKQPPQSDASLSKSGGRTVQQPEISFEVDDMINNILEG